MHSWKLCSTVHVPSMQTLLSTNTVQISFAWLCHLSSKLSSIHLMCQCILTEFMVSIYTNALLQSIIAQKLYFFDVIYYSAYLKECPARHKILYGARAGVWICLSQNSTLYLNSTVHDFNQLRPCHVMLFVPTTPFLLLPNPMVQGSGLMEW